MGILKSESECSAITQEIIRKVNCPYQVFSEDSAVEEVNQAYEQALARGQKEGFVPALVPSDDTLAEWLGILEDEQYSKEKILAQPCDNGAKLLQEWYEGFLEDYGEDFGDENNDFDMKEFLGEKENGEEILSLTSFMKYTGNGIEETILFEIPVDQPWKVIAYLPMGGWNDCPAVEDMIAVCRYWYEEYGAVPAVITHDTMEFVVEEPVDEEKAWALAKEHFAFCPDRVDQCTQSSTLGEVADCLSQSTVWYFWWD